jgi:NADPH-dependent glutamate synthase beta subunit-like oxidoreductase
VLNDIGAGPAGLAAAYHLTLLGHAVTVMDGQPKPGGMMRYGIPRYGIPRYRLPRPVLEAEIQRIADLGVRFVANTRVENVRAAMVYGGGNTALDAARTARRLGHKVTIVYRRTRERMPAHEFEVREALEENITLRCLTTIVALGEGTVLVEQMALDRNGWPRPTGQRHWLRGDSLILALGQNVEVAPATRVPGIRCDDGGTVSVDGHGMTGDAGVFAGGDMVPSDRSLTVSIGHGKRAARGLDGYLRGLDPAKRRRLAAPAGRATMWSYAPFERARQPVAGPGLRRQSFAEVVGGLSTEDATREPKRCLSCGNCSQFCPCGALSLGR